MKSFFIDIIHAFTPVSGGKISSEQQPNALSGRIGFSSICYPEVHNEPTNLAITCQNKPPICPHIHIS
jgi:hypothetical protein